MTALEGGKMKPELAVWLDMDVDIIEVAILFGSFWQVFRLRYDITAMLRIIRRMNQKRVAGPVDRGASPVL